MRNTILFGSFAFILFLLSGLTLLDLRNQETVLRRISETAVRHEAASKDLNAAVLQARAGLLRNYDVMVSASDRATTSLRHIEAIGTNIPAIAEVVKQARDHQERQQALVERFKNENALLQNALLYFSTLSRGVQQSLPHDTPMRIAVSELVASMLAFTLDPSNSSNVATLQAGIAKLKAATENLADGEQTRSLIEQAQLAYSTLSGVDFLVRSILSGTDTDRIIEQALAIAEERHANLTRACLAAFSIATVLMAAACIAMGFQLRKKMRTIRARKELDAITAEMSLHSINATTSELNVIIERALHRLAKWAGADRSRYVSKNRLAMNYDSVPGSPHGSARLLEQFALQQGSQELMLFRKGQIASNAELSQALLDADVGTWFCYRSSLSEQGSLLTLERRQGNFLYSEDILNMLREQFDAIVDAIERVVQKTAQRALEARLHQAQRQEAVGSFASGIAHNLNNITAAIRGHAEMAGDIKHGERLDRHLKEILKSADRAHDVVSDIMAFGHPQHLSHRKTDVSAFVREVVQSQAPRFPMSIRLEQDIEDAAFAFMDKRQIEQVLLNLIRNAWQTIGQRNGLVRIHLRTCEPSGSQQLSHGSTEPGRYVVLSVADDGEGMTQDIQDRLFEPFFSTRDTGSGLGLATVKRIVVEHRGALDVDSEPGSGSTISVWLPMESPERIEEVPGSGKRVLLVGRKNVERLKTEETVAALGYEPVSVADQASALGILSSSFFDAVLLVAQSKDNFDYSKLKNPNGKPLPIVVIGTGEAVIEAASGAVVVGVLQKPVAPTLLAASLAKAVRQSSTLTWTRAHVKSTTKS